MRLTSEIERGIVVTFDTESEKMLIGLPPGVSLLEAISYIQPRIDRANRDTGLNIQLALPEEP